MNIYLLSSLLFVLMAVLGAVDAASASFDFVPWFNGLRWLRVHLITLGVITNAVFGLLPVISASLSGNPKPRPRLDTWLALNSGVLVLLVAIPLINQPLIILGGTLVFVAVLLLSQQIISIQAQATAPKSPGQITSRHFYIAGLVYLGVGIYVGTGLWLGWPEAVGMHVPIEVHIHANNWGFLSLVFAGLLIDLFPQFSGQSLAWPHSSKPIFWLMVVGAFGLVFGPWFQLTYILLVPGLLMHLVATIWMVLNIAKPLKRSGQINTPGSLHLVLAYFWMFAPVLVAPLVLLKVPGFPGIGIEQNAPQALIYGWSLQFVYALLPYIFSRAFTGEKQAALGGTWFSLLTVNLGGVFLWASIFNKSSATQLHGTAYALWALSMLPVLAQIWRAVRHSSALPDTDQFSA